MIHTADELKPSTLWGDTIWGYAREEDLTNIDTNPRLCVAALLPFRDGHPDWKGFEKSLHWMHDCAAAY